MSSRQPAEGGLFNAFGLKPLPERGAQMLAAGFQPLIPVISNLSDPNLETCTRILQGVTSS